MIAYIYHFIHNVRKLKPWLYGPLTSSELSDARRHLIIAAQHCNYPKELAYLLKTSSKCPLLIKLLRLFIDDKKFIRCSGRIHNSPTTDLSKFPYLLPKKHPVTQMIVMDTHKKLHHGGVNITVTALYQIPSMRQCMKSLVRHCVPCRKLTGKHTELQILHHYQRSESLKLHHLPSPVWTSPELYLLRKETKRIKFTSTCAVIRTVHLEVVGDLTVDTFLLAFRKFSSRKSLPNKMIFDNASTYLAAVEAIQNLLQSENLKGTLERGRMIHGSSFPNEPHGMGASGNVWLD